MEFGKALEQRLEDFLHDVLDVGWLRHEPPDPSPDQRIIEIAELLPGVVILGAQEPIQEAERGIHTGQESSRSLRLRDGASRRPDGPNSRFSTSNKRLADRITSDPIIAAKFMFPYTAVPKPG
jgi:hypothetical protein